MISIILQYFCSFDQTIKNVYLKNVSSLYISNLNCFKLTWQNPEECYHVYCDKLSTVISKEFASTNFTCHLNMRSLRHWPQCYFFP